jgi:hypothetical protein
MAFWYRAHSNNNHKTLLFNHFYKCFFCVLRSRIYPCSTAGMQIGIQNCHATRGHHKTAALTYVYSLWGIHGGVPESAIPNTPDQANNFASIKGVQYESWRSYPLEIGICWEPTCFFLVIERWAPFWPDRPFHCFTLSREMSALRAGAILLKVIVLSWDQNPTLAMKCIAIKRSSFLELVDRT